MLQNIDEIVLPDSRFERGSRGALGQSGYQLTVSRLASACKAHHTLATSDYHWYYGLSQKISRVSDTPTHLWTLLSPQLPQDQLFDPSLQWDPEENGTCRSYGEDHGPLISEMRSIFKVNCQYIVSYQRHSFTHVLDLDCATAAWASRASYFRFHPVALSGSGELVS